MTIEITDRFRGTLVGLAAGDALGTTLEFSRPGTFDPIGDMVGGGPFGLAPGEWTDDTAMALCLADSLVSQRGFDPVDQMARYVNWHRTGYMSSTGSCFDIGNTVAAALNSFERDGNPLAGSRNARAAGNGSLMRLAPVPLAWSAQPGEAICLAGVMSTTTHAADEPVDACRYYAGLIVGALQGMPKDRLLGPRFSPVNGGWAVGDLAPAIDRIASGSFKQRQPPDIRGSGYVVHSLEAALWAFWHTDSFRDGALAAVNLGEDADTTGAIYGQLAGACYGVGAIPAHWREQLALRGLLEELADGLFELSGSVA